MLKSFISNIELWLSGAGLVVVWLVFHFSPIQTDAWRMATLAALLVATLHGAIFWLIRRRQLHVRREAITQIRQMLAHQVNNRLAVILLKSDFPHSLQNSQENTLSQVQEAVDVISNEIDRLSEDSLSKWHRNYGGLMNGIKLEANK